MSGMKQGLLWYDGDPARDLRDKVLQAARRYRTKFGVAPNTCYVHPSALDGQDGAREWEGVRVTPLPSVLPNHLWVGQEDVPSTGRA